MASKFEISTIFRGVDKVSKPMGGMTGSVQKFGRKARRVMRSFTRSLDRVGATAMRAGRAINRMALVGGASAAGIGVIGAKLEQTLVNAGTKFGEMFGKGTEGFAKLEAAARKSGATTEFTASASAEALNNLGLAGFNAAQAMASLPGIVDLATVAQVSLADSARIGTKTLGAFGLKVTDTIQLQKNLARVSDVMAATQAKTNVTMESMFETVSLSGATFRTAGISIEEFAALAGTLGNAAIDGSSAGTALQQAILKLVKPSASAQKGFRSLGVAILDSAGELRPVIDVFADLEKATESMTKARRLNVLQSLFDIRGGKAVASLLGQGMESVRQLRGELDAAGGSTTRLASIIRDTTSGSFKTLISTLEEVAIATFKSGDAALDFQGMLEKLTATIRTNQPKIVAAFRDTLVWIVKNAAGILFWAKALGIALVATVALNVALKASLAIYGLSILAIKAYGAALKITAVGVTGPLMTALAAGLAAGTLIHSMFGDTAPIRAFGDFLGVIVDGLKSIARFELPKGLADFVGLTSARGFVTDALSDVFGPDTQQDTPQDVPQVTAPVSQDERISRSIQESTSTSRSEIVLTAAPGTSAEVVGGSLGGLKLNQSGAL